MIYIRTFPLLSEGGGQRTHLDGVGDSSTLCGDDYAGDDEVHRKPPVILRTRQRVTCSHCLGMISIVRAHLSSNNLLGRSADDKK